MELYAEFSVFPFEEGEDPPSHVAAAIEALQRAGLEVELSPLSQIVRGEAGEVLEALRTAQVAAIEAGATKVVVNIEVVR